VGEYSVAEEVTQDVFQHVWQSAGGFQAACGTGAAWIIGITRHRAIDATRSRRFRVRAREQRLLHEYPADEAHSPPHYAQKRLLHVRVRAALATLPGNQRQAIELAYYGGLSYPEIAARVGSPCGTIKTRVRLGIRKLRALLADAEVEAELCAIEAP
jgi:RNA polymerase sigma-70 factor (ECF subfamily)